jgi:serine phosphatase RsbU (regulator of sigma subunit)
VDAIDVFGQQLGAMLDATSVSLLLTNFGGDAVVRLSHVVQGERDGGNERAEVEPLAGSTYQRVLSSQVLDIHRGAEGWEVIVPVTERGDAIGLLELVVPHLPGEDEIGYLESAAHALAYVLVASRRHTDLFEWAQRDTPFSLAAEIQRRLLPSAYTLEAGPVTLAGWLEPAANVGGDTFDYALDREFLYLSITDAMGHSTKAAMLATLTVGSLRNTRRLVASPTEQADHANEALLSSAMPDEFVTGLIGRLRLADGRLELVNAGHPLPFLLREGRAEELELEPDPVLGVDRFRYRSATYDLEPGDRLVFITDGFLERNAVGIRIPTVLEGSQQRHPRETVRELSSHVLTATDGNLRDDATVLCMDWHGPGVRRDATAGASRQRATRPARAD